MLNSAFVPTPLFSAEPVLNQLSFFLVVAVLLDTLLVRSILVPAYMALLGAANWWPSRAMPAPTRHIPDLDAY